MERSRPQPSAVIEVEFSSQTSALSLYNLYLTSTRSLLIRYSQWCNRIFTVKPIRSEVRQKVLLRFLGGNSPRGNHRQSKNAAPPPSKKCDASTIRSNNFGVSRKRFKPSTPSTPGSRDRARLRPNCDAGRCRSVLTLVACKSASFQLVFP